MSAITYIEYQACDIAIVRHSLQARTNRIAVYITKLTTTTKIIMVQAPCGSDKHSSLQLCEINYGRKKFYEVDPWRSSF